MRARHIGHRFLMVPRPVTHCSRHLSWNMCPHSNLGTRSPCSVSSKQIEQCVTPSTCWVPRHNGATVSRPSRLANRASVTCMIATTSQKSSSEQLKDIISQSRVPPPIYEWRSSAVIAPAMNMHLKTWMISRSVMVVSYIMMLKYSEIKYIFEV